ncbi:hypothetical protein NA57DRAFT_78880 [Rhizodiscina lignyota]|uniref:Transketolase-like pyrimidine-binding domain-containing protein n=1 Tax=Rhizodiscina lignyota TaxID=1504668 RepID=A0A9P4I9U5_9PEZI|nr:hypothetical protein NA57DRAFT_78880 [Rhizodiscina lignyota]
MNGHLETNPATKQQFTDDEQAVRDIRKLVIDCCRQNGAGHGGSAIGMAPLGVALWKHIMRYNPKNGDWFDRDRFVLSNGHAAIFLYTMLHMAGYPDMKLDELKMYADPKNVDPETGKWKHTICHGHPEIDVSGVEVTTGPLGQGVANSVGLAIAAKSLATKFNKDGHDIISSRIYCVTGDGCLQEGVANEAVAIAGHLQLDNLILLYDNNQVTCDGPADWIVSEDTNAKFRSMGWHVIDVFDGDTSVDNIVGAVNIAKAVTGKPTLINIRTTIGYGTSTAGTAKSHHGTYSSEDAVLYAEDVSKSEAHVVSSRTKALFATKAKQGEKLEQEWNAKLESYTKAFPEQGKVLLGRIEGKIEYEDLLKTFEMPKDLMPTRTFNGKLFKNLVASIPSVMAGGADLWGANQLGDYSHTIFDGKHRDGQVIRYGIREHAMAAISNGLAAYSPGTFLPITATFFMFYLYAAPGVRMGALQNLKVIHIATHDTLGEGQNGPTHQPVEVDSLYRAMPNLLHIRAADPEEVVGAWQTALSVKGKSIIIGLARDPPKVAIPNSDRNKVAKGGYVVVEKENAQVTLISTGSELQFAVVAAEKLSAEGIVTRVVSMPCIKLFDEQSEEYQDSVLSETPHIISLEAYVSTIWARYCTASIGMTTFGYSGSGNANFARFGLDDNGVFKKVKAHVQKTGKGTKQKRWVQL